MRRSATTLRGVGELTDDDLSLFDQFRAKAREFASTYSALADHRATATKLSASDKAKYDALISRGSLIMKTVDGITSTIDGILAWVRGVFGMDGLNAVPVVIPYAVIGAALAAMGYFISDAVIMIRKLDLIDQGKLAPSDLDAGTISSGVGSLVTRLTLALAVGGALWLLYRHSRSS